MKFGTIRLATMLALLFWSAGIWADPSDPFPDVNPYDYYGNMTASVKVIKGGDALENVVVAVYCGSEVRAKGSPTDPGNPGVTYLTIYGHKTGEEIYFRVYDESDGFTYEKDNGQTYRLNGNMGTPMYPYELVLDDADRSITLTESTGVANLTAAGDVSFQRSFTEGMASTICLPYAMTSVQGGKVYEFVSVVCDPTEGWVATMIDATPEANLVSATEANKPYLFLPDGTGPVIFRGSITEVPAAFTAGTTVSGDWTYHGTYTRLTYGTEPFTGTVFGFAATNGTSVDGKSEVVAGQFVKAGTGAYMPAFRAYLTYSGNKNALQAPARGSAGTSAIPNRITVKLVSRSGAVTGVGSLEITTGEAVIDRWFELSGRPVDGVPTEPGIYINGNGKKVVIR